MAVKITQDGIDKVQDNTVDYSNIADDTINVLDLPPGCIIQQVHTLFKTQGSMTITTTDQVVPGMTLPITPKGNNSKFLIHFRGVGEIDNSYNCIFNIQRDGARININGLNTSYSGISMFSQTYAPAVNDNDSTPEVNDFWTLDNTGSTAGVSITFRLVVCGDGSHTYWYNRCFHVPAAAYEVGSMELTIYEIRG